MVTALNVAEKPSVAKELANILGNGRANRVTALVTSVSGHLMQTEFDAAHRGWNTCAPEDLFTAPILHSIRADETSNQIKRTLEREARKSQWLVLWLDCDREGENIAMEVKKVCEQANPHIRVFRAHFSALIPADIRAAVNNLGSINVNMADAVDARSELDLRVGAAFTRFQLVSYGPCQFPTLGFVVDRYRRIQAFQPEDFWHIQVEEERPNPADPAKSCNVTFQWDRGRVYDHPIAVALYEGVLENPEAVVIEASGNRTTRKKPTPLATVEMQKRATRWLGMSAERCMSVAETLYQRGLISYPRTETEMFKEGTDLQALIQQHVGRQPWGDYAQSLMQGKFDPPRAGRGDDKAHPPIHPTTAVDLNSLSGDDRKVYELVVRHFLACCSKDAIGQRTKIKLAIAGEGFHTSGDTVLERNFLEIYRWENWAGSVVPRFERGERFIPTAIMLQDGRTKPPSLLTEPDLIALMDNNGIGTDATIAEHINTILERSYAEKVDGNKFFKPTQLGLALVEGYDAAGFHLAKPHLRAALESDCKAIVEGRKTKEEVIRNCVREMSDIFRAVKRASATLETAVASHLAPIGSSTEGTRVYRRQFSRCGRCQHLMDFRIRSVEGSPSRPSQRGGGTDSRPSRYLHCDQCQKSLYLPRKGTLGPGEASCVICGYQTLAVTNGSGYTGNGYVICPYCYRNPPAEHGGQDIQSGFCCFNCTAQCPLARGTSSTIIAPCRKCGTTGATTAGNQRSQKGGGMTLRRTKKGKWLLSCCAYPACKETMWLPGGIKLASPGPVCSKCSSPQTDSGSRAGRAPADNTVLQVSFVFTEGAVPPGVPLQHTGCVYCDALIKDLQGGPSISVGSIPAMAQNGGLSSHQQRVPVAATGVSRHHFPNGRSPGQVGAPVIVIGEPETENGNLRQTQLGPGSRRPRPDSIPSRNATVDRVPGTPPSKKRKLTERRSYTNAQVLASDIRSSYEQLQRGVGGMGATNTFPAPGPPARSSGHAVQNIDEGIVCYRLGGQNSVDLVAPGGPGSSSSSVTSSLCYHCNERGHAATNCPSRQRGSGRSSSQDQSYNCFSCGQPGHAASNCPARVANVATSGTRDGATSILCYNCNGQGHYASNCPQRTQNRAYSQGSQRSGGTVKEGVVCYKCNKPGHYANVCSGQSNSGSSFPRKSGNGKKQARGGSRKRK